MVNSWVSHWRLVILVTGAQWRHQTEAYGFFFSRMTSHDITSLVGSRRTKSQEPSAIGDLTRPSLQKLNGLVCQGLKAANIWCKKKRHVDSQQKLAAKTTDKAVLPNRRDFLKTSLFRMFRIQSININTNRFYPHCFSSFSATKLE